VGGEVSISSSHTLFLSHLTVCSFVCLVFVVCVVDCSSANVVRRRFREQFGASAYPTDTCIMTSASLVFPTPVLTPIVGRPNNSSLQIMQQQLYQNARAIASPLGGGENGHLGLIMSPAEYILRPRALEFDIPIHPGILEAAGAGATEKQIADLKRVYLNELMLFTTYQAVRSALQNQIAAAVEPTYLQIINDVDFGFSDVLPHEMLRHLKTTYGILTGTEIEQNRAKLTENWDTSSPIESLWARIAEIRRIATNANQPIGDMAVMSLVLPMFERTGLFTSNVDAWNSLDPNTHTYATFMTHFTRANELRVTKLTSAALGYADANAATYASAAAVTPPRTTAVATVPAHGNNSGTKLYYCWSHGLGLSDKHTSATCNNRKSGHIANATLTRRHGGSNTFHTNEDRPPRNNQQNSTQPAT
jgi:hypothetical protein